jgi:protein-S-isoprenylcysteine O-methyltransferase Ste14
MEASEVGHGVVAGKTQTTTDPALRETVVPIASPQGAETKKRTASDLALDWVERLLVVALYVFLVTRIIIGIMKSGDGLAGLLTSLPMLVSEGLVVVFMLLRRTALETSRRWGDWLLASGASCVPLLVIYPATHPSLPILLAGAFVWLIGLIVQVHAKLTLRWSFGCVPAHRGLVLAGPYQFVRHPMYAGYALSHLGILAMNPMYWNLACYILGDGLQVPRILAEERLLSRDPRYRDYRAVVRYRLLPGLF